jgi:hypothetical protein
VSEINVQEAGQILLSERDMAEGLVWN